MMNYLIIANIYLTLFYGFYRFFLARETFFQLNRIYLVATTALSFILPMVHLEWLQNAFGSSTVFVARSSLDAVTVDIGVSRDTASPFRGINIPLWIYLYMGGVLAQGLLLIRKTRRLIKRLQANNRGDAYSFMRTIKVDTKQEGSAKVMAHELVHVQEWHTLDVLFVELIKIFNWFNPVIYFLASSLKLTHEYIADEKINASHADKIAYAELLISRTFSVSSSVLTNNFLNQSFIKNRIVMLLKDKSKRPALLKYVLAVPLFAAMLIFSSAKVSDKTKRLTDFALGAPVGGNFYKLVGSNIRYLPEAKTNNAEGSVEIAFEKNNSSIEAKVLNTIGYGQEMEVLRVLKLPAVMNETPTGKNILRVSFRMEYDGKEGNSQSKRKDSSTKLVGYENLEEIIIVGYGSSTNKNKLLSNQQDSTWEDIADFNDLDVQPTFPGGINAFYKWIGENFKYSMEAKEKGISGTVLVSYIIEKDGSLNNIKVVEDLGYGTGQAALDLLSHSPKWSPGQKNGQAVRVMYNLPIRLNLATQKQNETSKQKASSL